ncbi:MAG: amino acid permease [Candidatus Aenigmarchaeota archaeon]|nr:amino acid permease [Candidatus Aenigmarchaeota archaeon]
MPQKLKKELTLFTATLYGVGIILGAGIYVLIGQGAAIAGNAVWLSFIFSAILAIFTGLSYAELSGMFQKDAAEYVYTNKAFKKPPIAFAVQWIMLFAIIVSATAVAVGFGSYFSALFNFQSVSILGAEIPASIPVAAALLLAMSILNYIGIRESTKYNIVSTLIESSGLIIIIAIGALFFGKTSIDYFSSPAGIPSILSAAALIFFAYIGFEDLVNFSEETKNARKTIPRALVLSIIISTILYILVSIASITVIGSDALASSKAPLSSVMDAAFPNTGFILSIIALFATSNTVLALLIVASRMLYGLGCNKILPSVCAKVGKNGTPYISIIVVMFLSLAALLLGGIKSIASLTDIGIFTVYIFVNSALIFLRYRLPNAPRTFRSPINIGKFPVLALLGILSSILMLFHFEFSIMVYEIVIIAVGIIFYLSMKKAGKISSSLHWGRKKALKHIP